MISAFLLLVPVLLQAASTPPAALVPAPLTELEQLHREVVILQSRLHHAIDERDDARRQLAPLQHELDEYRVAQARTQHVTAVEAAHPCCTYDIETGRLTPKPPVDPKP